MGHIRSEKHGPGRMVLRQRWRSVGLALLATLALLTGAATADAKPAAAALSFTPTSHDFGRVALGERVRQSFTLTNTGRKTTDRIRVRLAGDDSFRVTRDSCSRVRLRPGRSCTITVRFRPDDGAAVTATLRAEAGKKHRRVQARATLRGSGSELGAPEDSGQIYWANTRAGTINRGNPGLAAVDTVVSDQNAPQGVAVSVGHVFWTSGGGQVWRADLDGTDAEAIVSGQADPFGLAIADSTLYWTNTGDGSIWRANLDGGGAQAVVTGQVGAHGIAVDATHLYWANVQTNTLWRANRDGSSPQAIVTTQAFPYGVAVDASHVYWANSADGSIWRADLDGSSPQSIVTGQGAPFGIAVGPDGLFWTDVQNNTVSQSAVDGSDPEVIITGQDAPQLMAFAAPAEDLVYWVAGSNSNQAVINVADLDGSDARTLVSGPDSDPQGVTVDQSHVYWGDVDGTIKRAALDGADVETFVQIDDVANGLAASLTYLYWTNTDSGTIYRASLDGSGGPELLVSGQNDPVGLAVDGSSIYWTNSEAFTVWRADLDGSGATAIRTDQAFPRGIAVNADHLYYATLGDGSVWRTNLDGTGATAIVQTGTGTPFGVAVNAANLYWNNESTAAIYRAGLDGTGSQAIVSGQTGPGLMSVTPLGPPQLAFSPATYDFGQVGTDQTASQTFTLTNSGEQASGALTVAVGGAAGLSITATTCAGVNLAPGASCSVTVRFAPTATGAIQASLGATSPSTAASADVELTGTGVAVRLMYWVNNSITSGPGTVNRARRDGTNARTLVGNQTRPSGIAVTDTSLYWAAGETIFISAPDGSSARALLRGLTGLAWLAADDTHLYWTRITAPGQSGTLWRAGLNGSAPQQIGSGGYFAQGVALDDQYVYWATSTSLLRGDGTIWRAGLDGSEPEALVTGQTSPSGVAVDADYLYWTTSSDDGSASIMRSELNGSNARFLIAGDSIGAVGLATDGTQLYWTDDPAGTVNSANQNGGQRRTLVGGQASPYGIAIAPPTS